MIGPRTLVTPGLTVLLVCYLFSFAWASDKTPLTDIDWAAYTKSEPDGRNIIHIPPGVYRISKSIRIPSNTIFEGEGKVTVLRAEAPFTGPRFLTNADFTNGNRNIIVRNLKIEFGLPVLPGDAIGILRFKNVERLEIDNLTMVLDSQMYGIDLAGQLSNATVERCTITNMNKVSGGGIMIRNGDPLPARATSDITVRNNRIESVSDEPLAVFGWQGIVEQIRIEKNTIRAAGASFGITAYGIDSKKQRGSLRDVQIVGNHISGGKIGGIAVKGGARSVDVQNNMIEDTKGDGIFLHSGGEGLPGVEDIRIHHNTILRAGRHCIFAAGEKIRVSENMITNCSQSGVYVAGDVSVLDNDIKGAKPGIIVDSGQENNIRRNTLHDCGMLRILKTRGTVFEK